MTKKLYHEDAYLTHFTATVATQLEMRGQPAVTLTQTAFYPTAGGQPHDIGTLNASAVVDVVEDAQGEIVHVLDRPLTSAAVTGQIDWARRFDHMQQHTGQHLLSQAFSKVCQGETVSFHLGAEVATIDIQRPDLDAATLQAVEHRANQIIVENRAIVAHCVSQAELSRFPVRKPPTVTENIRIIEITDFDYSPCGGTHVTRAGEIGLIKILKTEHYKGGTRIHFVCGGRAFQDYAVKNELVKRLGETFSCGLSDIPGNIAKLQDQLKEAQRAQKQLSVRLLTYEAAALLEMREPVGEIALLCQELTGRSPADLKFLATSVLAQLPNTVTLLGSVWADQAALVFACSPGLPYHMGQLMQAACAVLHGRGGGQAHQAQGGAAAVEKLAEALQTARAALLR